MVVTGSSGGGGSGSSPSSAATESSSSESESSSFWNFMNFRKQTTPPECSRNADCNKCANPTYDYCNVGVCVCKAPTQEEILIDTSRSVPPPECSRDTDCNKCANPAYDYCNAGVCVCKAPVVVPTATCTDTDAGVLRHTDGLDYERFGSCSDSTETIQANDHCSATQLAEYYCNAEKLCRVQYVDCQLLLGRNAFCDAGECRILV